MKVIVKKNRLNSQKKPLIISISRKNVKKSVDRSLVKRRVREIMRPFLNNKERKNDYFILVNKKVIKFDFEDLKKEIEEQLK